MPLADRKSPRSEDIPLLWRVRARALLRASRPTCLSAESCLTGVAARPAQNGWYWNIQVSLTVSAPDFRNARNSTGAAVGTRLGQLVGAEGSARGRHDEVGRDAEREFAERAAEELDHELPHPLGTRLARLAAAAEAGRPYDRKLAGIGLIGEPVQAVVEIDFGAGRDRLGRHPHRDHVVVDLVVGRDFAELDRSFAPALAARARQRLNPQAPAPVVEAAAAIMAEPPVALKKAETAWIVVEKGRDHDPRRIVERPPQALAVAGP